MIIVKMLGGAKKVFDSDGMNIDMDGITVAKLLDVLDGLKPKGSEGIEPKNTLVAINGSEISTHQWQVSFHRSVTLDISSKSGTMFILRS